MTDEQTPAHRHGRDRGHRRRRGRHGRGVHALRRGLQRHGHRVDSLRGAPGRRGRCDRRDRGRPRRQARRRRQARDPEGDRPQHQDRPQVGHRRGRRPRRHLPAVHPRERGHPGRRRRRRRKDPPAPPPHRARQGTRWRHRARPLRHPRPGLRPGRGRDPQGPRGGGPHRRVCRERRRGSRHQGRGQGGPGVRAGRSDRRRDRLIIARVGPGHIDPGNARPSRGGRSAIPRRPLRDQTGYPATWSAGGAVIVTGSSHLENVSSALTVLPSGSPISI